MLRNIIRSLPKQASLGPSSTIRHLGLNANTGAHCFWDPSTEMGKGRAIRNWIDQFNWIPLNTLQPSNGDWAARQMQEVGQDRKSGTVHTYISIRGGSGYKEAETVGARSFCLWSCLYVRIERVIYCCTAKINEPILLTKINGMIQTFPIMGLAWRACAHHVTKPKLVLLTALQAIN